MSYLDRLKAKHVPNPFEGFEGAQRRRVSDREDPFEGFEGGKGKDVSGNQPSPACSPASPFLEQLQSRRKSEVFRQNKPPAGADANAETYLPQEPSKPPKASVDSFRRQSDPGRCHVCGEREQPGGWFVAVLNGRHEEWHWLHAGVCHDDHRRRCAEARDGG